VRQRLVLAAVALILAVLVISTLWVAVVYGPDLLTVLSLAVIAVLSIGIFGAFGGPQR
jgi:hypothetical protein